LKINVRTLQVSGILFKLDHWFVARTRPRYDTTGIYENPGIEFEAVKTPVNSKIECIGLFVIAEFA